MLTLQPRGCTSLAHPREQTLQEYVNAKVAVWGPRILACVLNVLKVGISFSKGSPERGTFGSSSEAVPKAKQTRVHFSSRWKERERVLRKF